MEQLVKLTEKLSEKSPQALITLRLFAHDDRKTEMNFRGISSNVRYQVGFRFAFLSLIHNGLLEYSNDH